MPTVPIICSLEIRWRQGGADQPPGHFIAAQEVAVGRI